MSRFVSKFTRCQLCHVSSVNSRVVSYVTCRQLFLMSFHMSLLTSRDWSLRKTYDLIKILLAMRGQLCDDEQAFTSTQHDTDNVICHSWSIGED